MNDNYSTLDLVIDNRGVATLTLNRPDRHNALNDVMIGELRQAAARLGDDPSVRVVVLTGAGKSFCAGGDINWFAGNIDKSREDRIAGSRELALMLRDLNELPRPLIGRINGQAYGGGTGMMAVCDLAVGTTDSRFGLTETRLGLIPANISPYVVARIGAANARATMLSGALFDGTRAGKIGLLTHVVPDARLDDKVAEAVADHLQAAPGATARTKALIDFVAHHDMDDNIDYTAAALADAWETEEGKTGISCFLDKTPPPWRAKA